MPKKSKKAFTLTELLVVVVVIGVLAAVVLPKFNKVMETRKTTEAEEMMAAVRAEQERRCALDENYLTDLSKMTDIMPSSSTKNFSYSVTGTGIAAQSKGKYGYTLKMPSYRDGRICCENAEECAKLNKDYPLCQDLIAYADYQNGMECAGTPSETGCSGSSVRSCGCLQKGTQTRSCDTSTGQWSEWGACSIEQACDCAAISGEAPAAETQACNSCGTQTRSYVCDTSNGTWQAGEWSSCSKSEAECESPCPDDQVWNAITKECECPPNKMLDTATNTCVCKNAEEKEACKGEYVGGGLIGNNIYQMGTWVPATWDENTCTCIKGEEKENYYFLCVSIETGEAGRLFSNTYGSYEEASAACRNGENPNAEFYLHLDTSYVEGCRPYKDSEGYTVQCPPKGATVAVRYQCSTTAAPERCIPGTFCQKYCRYVY